MFRQLWVHQQPESQKQKKPYNKPYKNKPYKNKPFKIKCEVAHKSITSTELQDASIFAAVQLHNMVKNDVKRPSLPGLFVHNAHDISIATCEDVRGVL